MYELVSIKLQQLHALVCERLRDQYNGLQVTVKCGFPGYYSYLTVVLNFQIRVV